MDRLDLAKLGMIPALLLLLLTYSGAAASIAVVTDGGVPAYGDALEGLRAGLGNAHSLRIIDAADPRHAAAVDSLVSRGTTDLVVALGADALAAVLRSPRGVPVVSTMVLGGAHRLAQGVSGQVHLNPDFSRIVGQIRKLYPDKPRIGVIYNPATGLADIPAWKPAPARTDTPCTPRNVRDRTDCCGRSAA